MDVNIYIILYIISVHFIADFLCQTDWMALNKSKNNYALGSHVGVYTIVLFLTSGWFIWAIVNGILHFITDYITSRITSKLWAEKKVRLFFNVIGLDQLIHYTCLFITYVILF
jgi:hypothetical protein